MGAEAHAVGVGDADAGGDDVVRHARELVDAVDRQVQALGAGGEAGALDVPGGDGADGGPRDVGQEAEDAVQVLAVGLDQAVAQQVQAQVGVVGVERLVVGRGDDGAYGDDLDAAARVRSQRLGAASPSSSAAWSAVSRSVPAGPGAATSSGAGNQVSRTVPSSAIVARPAATAPVAREVAVVSVMCRTLVAASRACPTGPPSGTPPRHTRPTRHASGGHRLPVPVPRTAPPSRGGRQQHRPAERGQHRADRPQRAGGGLVQGAAEGGARTVPLTEAPAYRDWKRPCRWSGALSAT